jgi:hypothetical protein
MGTSIGSTLQRGGGGSSPFPVAVQNDLRLPFVIVADIAARNNIEEWRRMSNMECYVISDPGGNNRYQLGVDTTLAGQNWTPTGGPFQRLSEKNQPGGYVGLEVDGYVDPVYIKSIYAQDYYTPEDETERFGLTTRTGDLARQLDNNRVYIKINNNPAPTIAADWADITTSVGISSVNGDSGPDIIIDIVGLLAYGSNQTEFDAAVAANSTVSALGGAVATNTSNIQDLFNAVTALQNKTSVNIPVYNPATQYQAGNNVLYDTGSGSKSLYRCHKQPPVGTDPTDVTYWELIAGGGGTSLTKSTTVQAQVATDDATYMTPLTSYEGWFSWIVNKTVSALNTTVKNIVGAINELKTRIDNIGDVGGGSGTGVFEPVQDITELKALNTTDGAVWKDKWALIVEDEESWYRYDRDSAVSESLPKIVAPTTGPGRFFQTPDVDLSAKADKTNVLELDNTTEFTPDADYEPATKKYVDDSLPADGSVTNAKLAQEVEDRIAANDAKTTLDVNMTDPILGDPNGSNINLLTQQKYLSVFNGPEISTTFAPVNVFITGINGANKSIEGARLTWYFEITDATIDKYMRFNGSPDPVSFLDYPNWDNATKTLSNLGAGNYKIEGELIGAEWQLEITALAKESILQDGSVTNAKLATEVEDRIAANTSGKADKTNVLELDNTTEFTPDADYEPATKKYVDDNLPDISNKEDRADIITVTDNAGTYELDQDSKRQRLYKTTTSISANKSVDVKNGLEGSVFSWYFQATGTIELDFSASTQTCNSDSSDWATKVLTLAGGTDSKFEIAGLYINGGWNIKVSGEML